MNQDFMVFMRKNYPQVADEQFEFGLLKAEDSEEKEDELGVDVNLQNDLSSQWPTCRFFLSFSLGFQRPNLITGLGGGLLVFGFWFVMPPHS